MEHKPTIDYEMSNEDYHATPAISSSAVKLVHNSSILHWKNKVYKPSAAFDLGTAVHALVLEPHLDLVVRGPETRRGNAWKDAKAEADLAGQLLLTEEDFDQARAMADRIIEHPVGLRMQDENNVNEMSVFVKCPETGLDLKARPDSYWPHKGVIYDIKTTQDASPDGFAREALKYNYAIQAVFYKYCLKQAGMPAGHFVFVCVEKAPPYAVAIHVLSEEYLDWAHNEMISTLYKIADAEQTGVFTTGWPEVNVIDLPRWLRAEPEDDINDDF